MSLNKGIVSTERNVKNECPASPLAEMVDTAHKHKMGLIVMPPPDERNGWFVIHSSDDVENGIVYKVQIVRDPDGLTS